MYLQYLLHIIWRNLGRSLQNYQTFTKMLASRRNIFTGSVAYVQYINYNIRISSISYTKETMRQSMEKDKNSLAKLQTTLLMAFRLSSNLTSMPLHFQVRIVELSPKLRWGVKIQEISIPRVVPLVINLTFSYSSYHLALWDLNWHCEIDHICWHNAQKIKKKLWF